MARGVERNMFRQGLIFACGVVLTLVGVAGRPQRIVNSFQALIQRSVKCIAIPVV